MKRKGRWAAAQAPAAPSAGGVGDVAASEADYMSDAFLARMEEEEKQAKKGKQQPVPLPMIKSKAVSHQEASQRLQEGLSKPLGEENRGLKLLKLMGYREGKGLGRSIEGIKVPLSIEVATQRRSGLGVVQEQRLKEDKAKVRRKELSSLRVQYQEEHQRAFKESMSSRFTEKRVRSQLVRARQTVETLDSRLGRDRSFLWLPLHDDEERDDQDDKEGRSHIRLLDDGDHCGPGFHDRGEADDTSARGGAAAVGEDGTLPTSQQQEEEGGGDAKAGDSQSSSSHQAVDAASDNDDDDAADEEAEVWRLMPEADKLTTVLQYLRTEHHYCLFCGHQYDSAKELQEECPGASEDDH